MVSVGSEVWQITHDYLYTRKIFHNTPAPLSQSAAKCRTRARKGAAAKTGGRATTLHSSRSRSLPSMFVGVPDPAMARRV